MPSLIPGYEYDIFISYRQKDNRHDGWVTEFVDNLKGELESTFKEEIGVYFDINPSDGLLETHDVDASLIDKLKCLVFIPIISRTYCDPKSFAWEHEFKAFVEQASQDQFGLKVKLPNGNVASRVLPVRVHDLDNNDIKLCESVLGGVMRGVEFIYKSAGVNRPLRLKEENPQENLNHTNYRDQINKVANAIKEIITGLKNQDREGEETLKEIEREKPSGKKGQKIKILAGSLILLAFVVAGFFIVSKLIKPEKQPEKSIAVIPFKSLSDDPEKQYQADAMMDAIIEHLSKIKDLHVKPRTSVEQFRGTIKTPKQIGRELDVPYILEGSFQRYRDSAVLNVRLIRANNEDLIWTNNYNRNWNNVFSVQREVAQTIARELKVVITPEEQQLIEKTTTNSLTAYDFYMKGREEHMNYMNVGIIMYFQENLEALNKAGYYYNKALEYDSTFALAYTGLALIYNEKHIFSSGLNTSENYLDSTIILADKALTYDDKIAEAYDARALYYTAKGLFKEALAEYDKSLKLNPNDWLAFNGKGNIYFWEDMLQGLINLHKAANLLRGSAQFPSILRSIADLYSQAGFHEKAKEYIREAFTLDNDSVRYFDAIGKIDFYTLNYEESLKYLGKGYKIDSVNVLILNSLGITNLFAGNYVLSLKYYKKYLEKLEDRGQVSINETHRIAYAFFKNGFRKEADYYFNKQIELSKNDIKNERMYSQAKYTYYDLAAVYAFRGNKDMALKNLRIVNEKTEFPSWGLYYIKNDPLIDNIRSEPEFQKIARDLESKYNLGHERVRKWLDERGEL